MFETSEFNDPNQHPTLTEIVDFLGYDKISEFHFDNSAEPCVHFIYNENKFTLELLSRGNNGETISIDVEGVNSNESLGFFNLSVFNFEEQIDLIVNTILNYD
jgi:hypothetical protein